MKRIFIVGASVLQLPAILKAKEMGLYVGVADYNPDADGVPYADVFFEVSTIDEQGICEAARAFHADGIMTLATDMPMRSVAYTAAQLGLSGISYDTAVKATDKGEMIKAFEANGVEHPWYYILSSPSELQQISDEISFPCISKPVDNAGSRGVMLIHDADLLQQAVAYSSQNGRNGSVIIEEYLEGSEVSVEIMVVHSEVRVLQVTDKMTTGAPHFVETGHTQPSRLGANNIQRISDLAKRAVQAVGINHGPAHVEIMLTKNGPKMIELGARMGGDCITTHLVPLSTGIDMVRASIQMALGEEPDLTSAFSKGAAIRYLSAPVGKILAYDGVEEERQKPEIKVIDILRQPGDITGGVCNSADRIGFVISQADTPTLAAEAGEQAVKNIRISVEEI